MLIVKNDDRPGVIGVVGTLLGNAGVNIADMDVGAAADGGTAVMLIATSGEVPAPCCAQLRGAAGIHFGRRADYNDVDAACRIVAVAIAHIFGG